MFVPHHVYKTIHCDNNTLDICNHVPGVCTGDNRIFQLNLTHNSTGRVSSPDYPLQFPTVSSCYWRIKAPNGYRVKLQFTTINIQGNCREDVEGDWIRVDDFFTSDFGSVASFWGRFCGNVQPPVIYSTSNELQVFFMSNYTSEKQVGTNNGFYATYNVVPQGNVIRITAVANVHTTKRDQECF